MHHGEDSAASLRFTYESSSGDFVIPSYARPLQISHRNGRFGVADKVAGVFEFLNEDSGVKAARFPAPSFDRKEDPNGLRAHTPPFPGS